MIVTIVIIWVACSLAGTCFTWWVRRDAKKELTAVLRERINSVAEIETRDDLRSETIRLIFLQIPLDIIGWNALIHIGEQSSEPIDWFGVVLFMTFNIAVTYLSYITFRGRKRSLAILRKQHQEGGEK